MTWIAIAITLVALYWLIASYLLSGENLSQFDSSIEHAATDLFDSHPEDAEMDKKIIGKLRDTQQQVIASKSIFKGLQIARNFADNLSCDLITDTEFKSVNANGVDCEWAIAPGSDPAKRLVFFHGGAFLFGSAKGHRKFSDQLSKISGAAVLSVNYRMLPRYSRKLGIQDAQQAYLWAIDNGPNGQQTCDFMILAGDSAGGNLSLMLSSWSKHNAPKRPDAVLGFSPSLDQTLRSPSLITNQRTDPVLGNGLGQLINLPQHFRMWVLLLGIRYNPSNPLASPVYGDLSDLPPTLIHASTSEMLVGESIRYVNRARAQGSEITFQAWRNQVHDWHLFNLGHGSADVAWNEVAKFLSKLQQPMK